MFCSEKCSRNLVHLHLFVYHFLLEKCSLWASRFVSIDALLVPGRSPKISRTDRILMCWWAFTGLTHIILEGYFAFSPEFYKKKSPLYFAEVCKFSYKYRSR